MAGHPLRSATDRRFGRPLPHQLANQTRVHLIPPEFFTPGHATLCAYAVLAVVSNCYPPVWGRLPTRYSPVRHSVTKSSFRRNQIKCFVRLACVKHAASVHPEPGSNSHVKKFSCPVINWLNQINLIYCFKVVSLSKRSCVVIHNTLKFIESFKVISLFSYQGSLFCCRSRRQLVYYILSSLFCQELFFIFWKFLSIDFVRSVISNATTLIFYHVLFCLSRTFLNLLFFWIFMFF